MVTGARIVRLCLGAFAVCIAALLAHAAIDALGDVFLAHDAYDDVPHHSRTTAAFAAIVLFAPAAFRFAEAALRAVLGEGADLQGLLRRSLPRSRTLFTAGVVAAALPVLAGMEALDLAGAGRPIDDLGDLLAGAPLFTVGVLVLVAGAVALTIHWAFTLLLASTGALLATLTALLRARRTGESPVAYSQVAAAGTNAMRGVLGRHGGLRAPPSLRKTGPVFLH